MILVTGATGTVGRELVGQLRERGADFKVAGRDPERIRATLGPDVQAVPLDFAEAATLESAFSGAARVYLLTPNHPEAASWARQAVDAARAAGVELVVRQSVLGADDQPGYLLGLAHREVELYLVASGVPGTILRPNTFFEALLAQAAQTGRLALPLGSARLSCLAASDVAAVAAEVLTADGYESKSFDLTGPEALTMEEAAAAVGTALGRLFGYQALTPEEFREALAGRPEVQIEGLLSLCEYALSGAAARVTHTVEEITGRPARDVRSWAAQQAAGH